MTVDFRKQTALITGASAGIGAALAKHFAAAGARCALVARRAERLEELAEEIVRSGGADPAGGSLAEPVRPVIVPADLCEDDAPQRVVAAARDQLGRIDILVNNAGLGYAGSFADHTPEQSDRMIELNMRSVVRLTHVVLPEMLERRGGAILNVASTAAYQPLPHMATYAATKAFLLSWSQALWAELRRHGITVTCVNPGTTRTEFFDHQSWSKAREAFMKHAMTADQVADIGVRALAKNKPSAVCGFTNKLGAALSTMTPKAWIARAMAKVLDPQR